MAQGWDNNWDASSQWGNPQDYAHPRHNAGYNQQNAYQQPPPNPQNPYENQAGYGGFGQNNFMNNHMFEAAQHFGGQFAEQQKEKFAKYLNPLQLKYYFSVDNSYVGKKIGLLLFPFFHSDWTPKYGSTESPVSAKEDINAPDLYIPLMAFLTYVLTSGFVLGTQSRFSPEILGILTTNALIFTIIENVVIFVAKYVMNISQALSFFHSLAYSTYKFVGMTLCLLSFIVGGVSTYYAVLAYTSLALVFFLLRTVANYFESQYSPDGRKRKLILILFILITQPFIIWWLTSGVTSFDYAQYDFARKAMSKMGLKENSDLPLTNDGEVDYEALLKMPPSKP